MRPAAYAARYAAAVVAAVASAGCVPASYYHEPQLALRGTDAPGVDATAAALVGDWTGQYDAPLYARRGTLRLSLRRVARTVDGVGIRTVAGTATFAGVAEAGAIDSARVTPGRVVLWFQPMADQVSGATVQIRLDGALAADTLGGRLRADAAATVTPEHHGGWRLVRAAPPATASAAHAVHDVAAEARCQAVTALGYVADGPAPRRTWARGSRRGQAPYGAARATSGR